MLIPRYSLRWLLALITVSAGVSLVLSYAIRGQDWALGAAAGLGCLAIVMTLYAVTFLAAWAIAQIEMAIFRSGGGEGTSPFAGNTPPSPFGPPAAGLDVASNESPPPMTG
jgi:hypothetical protein